MLQKTERDLYIFEEGVMEEESVMEDNVFILPSREPAEPGRKSIHNLPAQLTPLIGREKEVAAVQH
jgi:hypothetical protein